MTWPGHNQWQDRTPTGDELHQLARRAERSLEGEIGLILSGGFALIMVLTFLFGAYTFMPLSDLLGIRPIVVWAVLSAVLAVLWAGIHARLAPPRIAKAKADYAAAMEVFDRARELELSAKMRAMKGKP